MRCYGIGPGENRRCEVFWCDPGVDGGQRQVLAVIPDASPLMAGDLLSVRNAGDTWQFCVNDLCVWTKPR